MKTLRRKYNRQYFLFGLFLISLLILEETYYGFLRIYFGNYYNHVVYLPIEKTRNESNKLSIAVIVIIGKISHLTSYELAQDSVKCYCDYYGYPYIRITADDVEYVKNCGQKDFMFKRHCIMKNVMLKNPKIDFFYFLDADMGIVNPNHLLEDYINNSSEVIFYERIFNYEFMAGSYIIKNTKYARDFLTSWYEYDGKVPKNAFHGTDNAAIHQVFLDKFMPENKNSCLSVWNVAKNWDGVWKYVGCTQYFLGKNYTKFLPIEIRSKYSSLTWVRDGWLTNSVWSKKDFMFHGWKIQALNSIDFAGWLNPFIPSIAQDSVKCYCDYYGYPYIRITADDVEFVKNCGQKDFMFKRHCIMKNVMLKNPKIDFFYFLDADMGIVNPNHLLEDYINKSSEVIFYERIFNYEFMAGSYIIKNTKYARDFLTSWYEYDGKVPKNAFHGTDNAAIHQVFLDIFMPENKNSCLSVWNVAKDWDGVWQYVGCTQYFLDKNYTKFLPIEIRPKNSLLTWVRDGWLTNSVWSKKDFMFHGWKIQALNSIDFAGWLNPFIPSIGTGFVMEKCITEKAFQNWAYKDTFMVSNEEVEKQIKKTIEKVKDSYETTITGLKNDGIL
uniref:Nucleotide-diphospho-sugar transferase domain-containing protein n=1 Tax=Panagrolaimus sp. JU765 TaxID=591449 RepID=A0AC34RPZ2_9BILA